MRSRYSAYVLELEPYLLRSWHEETRPPQLDLGHEPRAVWIGLEINKHVLTDATHAIVEFIARYRVGGRAHRLHEISRFVLDEGRWVYLDGQFPEK